MSDILGKHFKKKLLLQPKSLETPLAGLAILVFFVGMFSLSLIKSHQTKGTFWADETGVVLSSITKFRSVKQIYYDAANTSQPPLDHILREKVFVPFGEALGIADKYPEFFHRLPSLIWWLLPISYFAFNLKNYSFKNKAIIFLGLSLLISSQFLRHYLAEARHYAAIPAVFSAMIIVLLSDQIKLGKQKYHFLIISSLFPFLHLISFPYYLLFMAYFFYQIRKDLNPKIVIGYIIFLGFVLLVYYEIKRFSSPWQHPSSGNLNLGVVKVHIKWTLDWIFSGGLLYPLYKLIPETIKNKLLPIFVITSGLLSFKFTILLIRKKLNFINLSNLLLFSIVSVWPISTLSTLYFSSTSPGERYSITILPIVLFYASFLLVGLIRRTFHSNKTRTTICLLLILISFTILLTDILPISLSNLDTPDNQFVTQNAEILKDKSAYLILDNGVYSAAFFPLAAIHRIPIKVNYLQCREGQFQTNGQNTLNDWLAEHKKDQVYLYGLYSNFMEKEKIFWQKDEFVLYLLTHVPEEKLCQSPAAIGECYLKCIRGGTVSSDGRSIKGVAPNLSVYQN